MRNGTAPTIGIAGAGLIGCYVGGRLLAAGADVRFLGRKATAETLHSHGMVLTSLDGDVVRVAPDRIRYGTDASILSECDLVFVCVKGDDTASLLQTLGSGPDGRLIVALQNGIGNAERIRAAMPSAQVASGMVPFNVASPAPGHFHQGTVGGLHFEDVPPLRSAESLFQTAGLAPQFHADMAPVQWGKLLLNLNNAVNALSGVPLRQELSDPFFRRCLAMAQEELLVLLTRAGIRPVLPTGVPAAALPKILRLPTFAFKLVARNMLRIDATARSSMLEDLERRRSTEIEMLNGEVVRLAERLGRTAPVNARLRELVREAEAANRPPRHEGRALYEQLRAAVSDDRA